MNYCKKMSFPLKRDAKEFKKRLRKISGKKYIYYCPKCLHYHLTSTNTLPTNIIPNIDYGTALIEAHDKIHQQASRELKPKSDALFIKKLSRRRSLWNVKTHLGRILVTVKYGKITLFSDYQILVAEYARNNKKI